MQWFDIVIPPAKPNAPTWLEGQGYRVREFNGQSQVYAADQAAADAVQALVDGYDPLPLAKVDALARIAAELDDRVARNASMVRILVIFGRAIKLVNKKAGGQSLSPAEQTKLQAANTVLTRLEAFLDAAEAQEAQIAGMSDPFEVDAFDVTDPAKWPE